MRESIDIARVNQDAEGNQSLTFNGRTGSNSSIPTLSSRRAASGTGAIVLRTGELGQQVMVFGYGGFHTP